MKHHPDPAAASLGDGRAAPTTASPPCRPAALRHQVRAARPDRRRRARPRPGPTVPDPALLTDGLRAEREQGITIDVVTAISLPHSACSVRRRHPGHVQYTRNTVSGASTAAGHPLVDARTSRLQTRRHAAVMALRCRNWISAVTAPARSTIPPEVFAQIRRSSESLICPFGWARRSGHDPGKQALHGDRLSFDCTSYH